MFSCIQQDYVLVKFMCPTLHKSHRSFTWKNLKDSYMCNYSLVSDESVSVDNMSGVISKMPLRYCFLVNLVIHFHLGTLKSGVQ